ncbi:MAG: DNA-formamidopyrimidine glycosylase family protein [Candidatus Aminicenantes bacterium]
MPELPDVEVFKRYLDATSLHRTIQDVKVEDPRLLHRISPQRFQKNCIGCRFQSTSRHGKYLFVRLDTQRHIYFHFGMTGSVNYFKKKEKQPEYSRILFHFSNGSLLVYVSQRVLGEIGFLKSISEFIDKKNLGADALKIEFKNFKHLIQGRRGAAKSFLMNQKRLAGIGNTYADEILFQASIHPETDRGDLGEERMRKMFTAMNRVLKKAVDCRAEPDRFPPSYLIPQRKKDGKCPRSHGELKKILVNGRSTYFCPVCQKK